MSLQRQLHLFLLMIILMCMRFIVQRMHNLIQELRGNVRVFARIRPYLPDDQADDDSTTPILANGENAIKVVSNFHICKPLAHFFVG